MWCLPGCSEDHGNSTPNASSVSQDGITVTVEIWKSSGDSVAPTKTMAWSFDQAGVLAGPLPMLDGVTDFDPKDELFRIQIQYPPTAALSRPLGSGESLDRKWLYRVFRARDDRLFLSSGGVGIHRILKSTPDDVLEDALAYLKGETRWNLFQYFEGLKRKK
jgi:hypothetical protein